jgi:hypothetical protein
MPVSGIGAVGLCLQMTLDAGVDGNGQMVWGAHYLSGMAKALVEDIAHGMMTEPVR